MAPHKQLAIQSKFLDFLKSFVPYMMTRAYGICKDKLQVLKTKIDRLLEEDSPKLADLTSIKLYSSKIVSKS